MSYYFDVDKFAEDCRCSAVQASIAADSWIQGRPQYSHLVRAWNPDGPDNHITKYIYTISFQGAILLGEEERSK